MTIRPLENQEIDQEVTLFNGHADHPSPLGHLREGHEALPSAFAVTPEAGLADEHSPAEGGEIVIFRVADPWMSQPRGIGMSEHSAAAVQEKGHRAPRRPDLLQERRHGAEVQVEDEKPHRAARRLEVIDRLGQDDRLASAGEPEV